MSKPIFQKTLDTNIVFEAYNNQPPYDNLKLHQTHSNIVIDSPNSSDIQGDGLISTFENNLCVVTADCLPIAFIGKEKYALVHAGWKGIQSKIIINKKIQKIKPYIIFIGPSIQSNSFEVSPDFQSQFPHSKNFINNENKLFFNLQQEIIDQARQNYPNTKIIDCQIDTLTNKNYHSYRRDKTRGRNFNCLRHLS